MRRSKTTTGLRRRSAVDATVQHRLLNGLDAVGLTLQQEDAITAFEEQRPGWLRCILRTELSVCLG